MFNKMFKKENKYLKAEIPKKRTCNKYCEFCINGIKRVYNTTILGDADIEYICSLNCQCLDFQIKEGLM